MTWITYKAERSQASGLVRLKAVAGDVDLGQVADGLRDFEVAALVARGHAVGLGEGTGCHVTVVIERAEVPFHRCDGCGGPVGRGSIRPWACSDRCYADELGISREDG